MRDADDKKRRLEEAERKREAMQAAKEKQKMMSKPNFVIQKRGDEGAGLGASLGMSASDKVRLSRLKLLKAAYCDFDIRLVFPSFSSRTSWLLVVKWARPRSRWPRTRRSP